MSLIRRAVYGVFGGVGGTVALSAFREVLSGFDLVGTTAPEQVVARLEELGLLGEWSPGARRALVATAHFAYGVGIGAFMGLLRRERGGAAEEASAGAALGVLAWGAGWATWLPLTGVDLPPWKERTPRVLLPILDHLVFGAVWGLVYRAVSRGRV